MKSSSIYFLALLFFLSWMILGSCSKENPITEGITDIGVSTDTLRFDTVFTSIGSATRSIKIYNNMNVPVSIPQISLSDAGNFFRMNVDGINSQSVNDVVIQARDSIYVFIEVTVDPDNPLTISPFIIEEALLIQTGETEEKVVLEAWGQNANYFPTKSSARSINLLTCNMGSVTWNDEKPYVIYGVLAIDSCELVIPAGTKIYVHGGIVKDDDIVYNDGLLLFLENGKLTVNGEADNPVIFQGDRLESEFQDVTGQWSGIRFLTQSKENNIRHAIIKNSIVGCRVDSLASLDIKSSIIFNSAASGLIGYAANVVAENCLLYNNGGYGMQFIGGGNYTINYCSFSNYNNQSEAVALTNYLCTDPLCAEEIRVFPLQATMTNSIIDGNSNKEILIDDLFDGDQPSFFNVTLIHNLVKHEDPGTNITLSSCTMCQYITLDSPIFLDRNNDIYSLDTMSLARGYAIPIENIQKDILGRLRDPESPDAGCFEFE